MGSTILGEFGLVF